MGGRPALIAVGRLTRSCTFAKLTEPTSQAHMREPDPSHERRALVEAVVASTVGTTIEWYDFFLYGTMAALVFPKLFFPTVYDPFVRQVLAFSTFTVGFIAR